MTKLLQLSGMFLFVVFVFAQPSQAQASVDQSECRAKDLNGIIHCFSPQRANWHTYEVPSFELCNHAKNPECTAEVARNAFLRNVMPCQESTHKVKSGDVLAPKDPVTGCIYTPGHVRIRVHEGGGVLAVSILTEKDHVLYNGVVLRYLQQKRPGVFSIYTRGLGNNSSLFWARANETIGPEIFRVQNKQVKKYLQNCFSGRERCD